MHAVTVVTVDTPGDEFIHGMELYSWRRVYTWFILLEMFVQYMHAVRGLWKQLLIKSTVWNDSHTDSGGEKSHQSGLWKIAQSVYYIGQMGLKLHPP